MKKQDKNNADKEESMDAIECIKTRRSVRKFTDEKVPVDVVKDIVELASYSPSWKNTQVIRYILVGENPCNLW